MSSKAGGIHTALAGGIQADGHAVQVVEDRMLGGEGRGEGRRGEEMGREGGRRERGLSLESLQPSLPMSYQIKDPGLGPPKCPSGLTCFAER